MNDSSQKVHVSGYHQYEAYARYNKWLRAYFSSHVISLKEMNACKGFFERMAPDDFIFYGHKGLYGNQFGDCVFSMFLAWRYLGWQHNDIVVPKGIDFTRNYFIEHSGEPRRPRGFYVKKIPKVDSACIGRRFRCTAIQNAIQLLRERDEWAMGSEMFQYLAIINPSYFTLMDGKDYLNVNLPGFMASSRGDKNFNKIPAIDFYKGALHLVFVDPVECGLSSGSGSFVLS